MKTNLEINNSTVQKQMRKGLAVAISFSISDALNLMASGKIEEARSVLEDALRYADVTSDSVSKFVGLDSVRRGKGFQI